MFHCLQWLMWLNLFTSTGDTLQEVMERVGHESLIVSDFARLCSYYEHQLSYFLYSVDLVNEGCRVRCILLSSTINGYLDTSYFMQFNVFDGTRCGSHGQFICLHGVCDKDILIESHPRSTLQVWPKFSRGFVHSSYGLLQIVHLKAHVPVTLSRRNLSKRNCYIIILVSNEVVLKTNVMIDTHEPTFNEHLQLFNVLESDIITFRLMDYDDMYDDQFIADVAIEVSHLSKMKGAPVIRKFKGGWLRFIAFWTRNNFY